MSEVEISDDTLEAWFAAAGAEYAVPEDAFGRVLEAAGESRRSGRARLPHPRLVAAAVLVIAAVGGATLWSGFGQRSQGGAASATGPSVVRGDGVLNGPAKTLTGGAAHAGAVPPTSDTFGVDKVPGEPAAPGQTTARLPSAGTVESGPTVEFQSGVTKGAAVAATPDDAKIVETASVALTVAKDQVSPVLTRLTSLAAAFGGYVASSTTAEAGSRPSGTVVLRVPAASFGTALGQLRALGTVTSTTSNAQDVTATYTDLAAHEASLKKTRDHYLTLLAKATTIGETLSVQQRVDDAQTQIDQLQGQINVLSDQASYATISTAVTQKAAVVIRPKPTPVRHQSGLSQAWHRAVDGFVTGVEALVARSGRAVLVLIVLVVGLGVLRVAWRVGRRRLV